ncbi:hypothetical protein GKE62_07660 [Novosphingobium sp. Gsoil 351]|nr:amidase family protein [Novosphingobium sp. Gsoil 351]QGN54450.1 hypothetical protein GKE62_07660 [Novosphingobium sp. Gsoil 351]
MIDFADLEARNAPLGAFVDFDRSAAFGQGPLSGTTVGVKSNIAVRGLPWTAGMGLRRGVVAEQDAAAVARLRGAGAAILGTLNMHEAALGSTTDNPFYGRTHNPHRPGHTPGGSSGEARRRLRRDCAILRWAPIRWVRSGFRLLTAVFTGSSPERGRSPTTDCSRSIARSTRWDRWRAISIRSLAPGR